MTATQNQTGREESDQVTRARTLHFEIAARKHLFLLQPGGVRVGRLKFGEVCFWIGIHFSLHFCVVAVEHLFAVSPA